MTKQLRETIREALSSILPITAIVLLLSITVSPLRNDVVMLFIIGAMLLIVGMGLFTLGADMAMLPMGEGIGVSLSRDRSFLVPIIVIFILGVVITIAEPDLQVLATQIPSVPNPVLIMAVALGVGFFLVVSLLRMIFRIPLSYLLIGSYALVFILAYIAPDNFVSVAYDSGGVTTGPITVPFIMALGVGLTTIRSDKNSENDAFGLVALGSIGPILAVLILGIFYKPEPIDYSQSSLPHLATARDVFHEFVLAMPTYAKEVLLAFAPIVIIFTVFQLWTRRFTRHQMPRIIVGFTYTYIGLVLFLTGANIGFVPAGQLIGSLLADSYEHLLIPIGMVLGYFIVEAEPAVHVLRKQVEEVSNGAISETAIGKCLSIGVAISVGLSMLRIITGINIFWLLVPGYLVALALTFLVPKLYTAVAFDSGGVASGAATTTFLLPLAMGACSTLGGNVMTDAFGCVAMVAMTPLITIQILGYIAESRSRKAHREIAYRYAQVEDDIVFFDE